MVGALKRNSSMLMVWLILNIIGTLTVLIVSILSHMIIQGIVWIGIAVWAELVAFGAYQETKAGNELLENCELDSNP